MLCELLSLAGFECRSAGDGMEALALIDTFRPSAAIIDVGLPGVDGFEVARRIRSNPSLVRLKLIALTGYGQQSDRTQALDAGFDAHLVKPVRFDQLAQLLSDGEHGLDRNESGHDEPVRDDAGRDLPS
jgi:CheY-like chemotaxis protein